MRQKKKTQRESQSNLTSFIANDPVEEDPAVTEKKMEKEVLKLVKLRKDIEQKSREEHRVMKNILKMQINEDILQSNEGHQEEENEKDDERQEYWMMTRQAGLEQGNLSVFKLILEGYGQVISQFAVSSHQLPKENAEQQLISQSQEWFQKGSLNSTYLSDYNSSFVHSLKQYQYLAQDITK